MGLGCLTGQGGEKSKPKWVCLPERPSQPDLCQETLETAILLSPFSVVCAISGNNLADLSTYLYSDFQGS